MSHMQILNLRNEFEELATSFSPSCGAGSSINTLQWFAENGYRSNRLRNGYDRAMEIANIILAEYENVRRDQEESRRSTENNRRSR